MSENKPLKLLALDTDDLMVISANCQDAVFKADAINWHAADNRFLLSLNRFDWTSAKKKRFWQKKQYLRRQSVLHIEQVETAQVLGIKAQSDEVYSVLSLSFEASEDGVAGDIRITLSNGAAINLRVSSIEMRLADLDAVWETKNKPRHAI